MKRIDTLVAHLATRTIKRRSGRLFLGGFAGATMVAVLTVGMAGSAAAEPGITDEGSTTGNVEVGSSISLTALTESFTLSGNVGDTVSETETVTVTVETNNLAGYAVTVQSETATLAAAVVGNTDSIPIGALSVRETGTTPYTPLSSTVAVSVHTQATRSAEGGDDLANDYQVVIPFVNEDTYSVTLDYVATTL